jgi:hypothetical protein
MKRTLIGAVLMIAFGALLIPWLVETPAPPARLHSIEAVPLYGP